MKNLNKQAKDYCINNKQRFTKPREDVLRALYNSNKALSAYEILDNISHNQNIKINPPTIYRAIDFWIKHGFIHKVESQNSYILCNGYKHHKGNQILICKNCSYVKEISSEELDNTINKIDIDNFDITSWNLELYGVCDSCK